MAGEFTPVRNLLARLSGDNPPSCKREQYEDSEGHPQGSARQYAVTPNNGGGDCGIACPDDQAKDGQAVDFRLCCDAVYFAVHIEMHGDQFGKRIEPLPQRRVQAGIERNRAEQKKD